MSGQWPPEWDDLEDSIPGEADQQDAETEAGLSAVAAYLASVPAPLMPGSVEARISAALAVESAARAGVVPANGDADGGDTAQSDGTVQWDQAVGVRVLRPVPARARVRRRGERGERGRRGERDVRKVVGRFVVGPLAVCLLIVLIALGLSHAGKSSSSSSANSLAAPAAGATAQASSAAASSSASGVSSAAASAAVPGPASTGAGTFAGTSAGFKVTESGTRYQPATLAQQVLAVQAREPAPSAVPTASAAASATYAPQASAPSPQLRACVLKVTGGVLPELVDRATYQGTPVYVIASSSRVWVVGLGCTVARTQLITSVPLAG
jgi:hypothetical protein